ncbi:MAG: hypothetical protein OQK82_03480 [Candidatus Pacearchaeota archaeon]|nr:hypothetical protein [Candidatus Pacearchaeota archaeon]
MATMISRVVYEKGIKTTEILILVLFASSAILMGLSQDKLMKANDISFHNLEFAEVSLMMNQEVIKASINHLVYCNFLDLTKYLNEPVTTELLAEIEEVKQECVNESLKKVENVSNSFNWVLNLSSQYKGLSDNSFQEYKKGSETLSNYAFWLFLAGIFLCFILILDMNIFEPLP